MGKAWVSSNANERGSYLSFLMDEWAKKPSKMAEQLPALPFVDWSVQRKGVATLWMELFLSSRCVFDLSTERGQKAWQMWWEHRQSTVDTAGNAFAPLNSLQMDKDAKNRSLSIQRSYMLMDYLPIAVGKHKIENPAVLNALAQTVFAIANAHNALVPAQFNAIGGMAAEAFTPFVVGSAEVSTNVKQGWEQHNDTVHPSKMRLPLSQNEIGLVGRPEYVFSFMVKEIVNEAVGARPTEGLWDKLESAFWSACHGRWTQLGVHAQKAEFFLPSLLKMVEFARTELPSVCPPDKAMEFTARLEKLSLLAVTGAWPWEKEASEPTSTRRRRM